jgi:hypothetical protein
MPDRLLIAINFTNRSVTLRFFDGPNGERDALQHFALMSQATTGSTLAVIRPDAAPIVPPDAPR